MIHAAFCWPAMADPSLWTMVVHYPHSAAGMMVPIDLMQCTDAPHSHLKNMHVWDCPFYVHEPALQDAHIILKWKLHSCHAIFVSFSPCHSSLVPLVLNAHSGKISPKFHIVFDDWFTSMLSMGADDACNPSQWQELFTTSCFQFYLMMMTPLILSLNGQLMNQIISTISSTPFT